MSAVRVARLRAKLAPVTERLERTFNWARIGGAGLIFVLGPLFPNIGITYVFGLGTFVLGMKAMTLAMKAWAVIQAIVNFELTANPIGVVVMAIAALVAAVIYCYMHF